MFRNLAAMTVVSFVPMASAQPQVCPPEWVEAITESSPPTPVRCMVVFDEGEGENLWMAGGWTSVGMQSWICRYDGERILLMGLASGLLYPLYGSQPTVLAMTAFDDGSGLALYVGGNFSHIDGVECNGIARYRNGVWESIGAGVDREVRALHVHPTPSGPVLLAAGDFEHIGGVRANHLASWDGSRWEEFGGGLEQTGARARGTTLYTWDDGSGQALYVGGTFTSIGGVSTRNVARRDGETWLPLGDGLHFTTAAGEVQGLIGFVEPDESRWLFARGGFTRSGEIATNRTARWDGERWHGASNGVADAASPFDSFCVFAVSGTDRLYAAGSPWLSSHYNGNSLYEWVNGAWMQRVEGKASPPQFFIGAMHGFRSVHGDHLYLGGQIVSLGEYSYNTAFRWDGDRLSLIPSTHAAGANNPYFSVVGDGNNARLYASGRFESIWGENIQQLAMYDGVSWRQVPTKGLDSPGNVRCFAEVDHGSGPVLYALGQSIGAWPTNQRFHFARLREGGWEPQVRSPRTNVPLVVFDAGDGAKLYGVFSDVGARYWDGSEWRTPGNAVFPTAVADVRAMVAVYEPTGPALYLAGSLYTSGGPLYGLARFKHGAWETISIPNDGLGHALAAAGPKGNQHLYVVASSGRYEQSVHVYEFRDETWHLLTGDPERASYPEMRWVDLGDGGALHIFGGFTSFQGVPCNGVVTWRNGEWRPFIAPYEHAIVSSIVEYPINGRRALWLGGVRVIASRNVLGNFAILQGCLICYPDCDDAAGPGVLDIFDFLCFSNRFAVGDPYACDCDVSTGVGVCDLLDYLCFANAFAAGCE